MAAHTITITVLIGLIVVALVIMAPELKVLDGFVSLTCSVVVVVVVGGVVVVVASVPPAF